MKTVLGAAGLTDFLKKNCQQNVACCQDSNSEAVSIASIEDQEMSIYTDSSRTTTLLVSLSPVSHLVTFYKLPVVKNSPFP
jgi:hypothetical protein